MMEELDLLKKSWKKDENSFEQVSEKQIYSMLHQKSSSIVKWILIISILEFVFWNVIAFVFSDEKYQVRMKEYGIENIMTVVNMVNYIVVIGFIYVFYKNYKSISTLDSTHQLMKNILSTRRTVQNYIWYNLGVITVTIVISIVLLFYLNPTRTSRFVYLYLYRHFNSVYWDNYCRILVILQIALRYFTKETLCQLQ